jgi:effector-binding domain-containing protein
VKTLRFYDAIELLRPAHVDRNSGYRYYSADQFADLGLILRLKAFGFSLREIPGLIRQRPDLSRLKELLLDKRDELVRRVRDDRMRLAGLDGWLEQLGTGGEPPFYKVVLRRVDVHTIASIRQSISRYSDAVNLFEELSHHAKQRNAASGPPAAIWHTCGGSARTVDCEVYMIARQPISGNPRVSVRKVPSGLMACVVHHGPVGAAAGPYAAARTWIRSHGYRIVGPKRELYWQGGVDQDRSSDVTEIQFPVAMHERQGLPGMGSARLGCP